MYVLLAFDAVCANIGRPKVINVSFETGSLRYKSLEQSLFVGAGRFILEDGELKAEYRISKVCKGVV